MKKQPVRIFIEVDRLNEYSKWEIDAGIDACAQLWDTETKGFFDNIIYDARFYENLFEEIQKADEIYMNTAIQPLIGGTHMGSPELWNGMMELAIEHQLTGKKVYNARTYKDIEWRNLDKKLLDQAFKKNFLYVAAEDYSKWEQVDIDKLLRSLKRR